MSKIWYSLFNKEKYNGIEPYFFNAIEYDFSNIIEQNYLIIKTELFEFLTSHQLKSYFNDSMVEEKNTWKTISLRTWRIELYENQKFFPKTLQIINQIPGLVSASFNALEPKGHIVPHCGDTNAIFRCHLGLSVPAKEPTCAFRVGNEVRSWNEGKLIVFVDAHEHEAYNQSDETRYIFLFDVVREEYIRKKKWICARVITSLFLQKWAERFSIFYKSPMVLIKIVAIIILPFAYLGIYIRNFLYKLKK